ncbi:hypothetical protein BDV96DRAFT_650386 [Lophiotrema nucula]|uniref:SH3 domain-containing protein n=1 Tax=Lophiotrema nucula TaxID=690887 RepID=A0A6A5YVN5_9PLEO|nr:hypothetical protein BDV96DRAFT_650386 [Lophiotrema nucula]
MDVSLHSPLLRLPRELRNQVYDSLFRGSCFKFTRKRIQVTLSYGSPIEASTSLPVWLLTSKQVLKEGLDQLYHTARCTRCLREPNVPGLKFSLETGRYEKQPEPVDNPRKLLSLTSIRALDLKDIQLSTYTTHPHVTPATFYICDRDGIRFLLQHLLAEGVTLNHLKLTLTLPTIYEFLYEPEDWKADLFEIEALARAKRVELVVQEPQMSASRVHDVRACRVAIARLQQELVRAAKSVVGAQDHECTVKNWKTTEHSLGGWYCRMRKGHRPSTDDEITVEDGDEVLALFDDSGGRDWVKVRRLKTGTEGLIPSRYIQTVTENKTSCTWHLEVSKGWSTEKEVHIQELVVHTY